MTTETNPAPGSSEAVAHAWPPRPDGSARLGAWLAAGARSALLLPVRWQSLKPTAPVVVGVVAMGVLLSLLLQRLYVVGPASFHLPAFDSGWLSTLALAAVCLFVLPGHALGAFVLLSAQWLVIGAVTGAVYAGVIHAGWDAQPVLPDWGMAALWSLSLVWSVVAAGCVFWRALPGRGAAAAGAALVLGVAWWSLPEWIEQHRFWYPMQPAAAERAPEPPRLELSQALMERQIEVIAGQLAALQPQRPGIVDLYVLTFAPFGEEDVFRRESAMVADVMRQRFDAAGRTLQLVNHRDTAQELPWATPLNLQRAIERAAQLMDPDEDVLFIHLTSHGARDGKMSARLRPMTLEALEPAMLKGWLDAAGIRHRVLSISACYSGSWVAPLADDGTLVMTAADAEHTSYGCGRLSELTFYGRAVFDEQLRQHTLSFEQALAAARPVIDRREREAGKSDGYSNPQLQAGAAIRERLVQLEARLQARAAAPQ